MDSLLRHREGFAAILLVTSGIRLVGGVVGSFVVGLRVFDPLLVVAAIGVAIWCTRPQPTRHARTLLLVSVILGGASVVIGLVLALAGLVTNGVVRPRLLAVQLLDSLPALAVPVVAVLAGIHLLRSLPETAPVAEPVPAALPAPLPVPVEQQPQWMPDQATGAVWHTAGEAASGAPASSWGQQGGGQVTWGQSSWGPSAGDQPPKNPENRPA